MKQRSIRSLAIAGVSSLAIAWPMAAIAQQTDSDVDTIDSIEDDGDIIQDQVVVTGSRLRRDEYSSISPVQNIDAAESRALGIFDIGDIISQSPSVTGIQFDGSVNAGSPTAAVEGVSEGGVGSNNIALRGLPASSTLLLVNGRRLGRSGVRGAPVAPDLNLIPSALVQNVEILTDGASSIYGSDAVAGVVNLTLRTDFEGFEVGANFTQPFDSGGDIRQLNFIGGATSERGSFTVAGEYFNQNAVIAGGRTEFNDCLRDIEVGTDGEIRSVCLDARPDNSVLILSQGFVFNTPGESDFGVPGFTTGNGLPNNFRVGTADETPFNLQAEEAATQLLQELERFNIYTTGKYDINLFSRDTVYFEASYSERNSVGRFTSEQIFPGVPGTIPQEDANGNLLVNPDGSLQQFTNPLNPFGEDALPVLTVNALNQDRRSNVSNFRIVGGIEGDLAFGGLGERDWIYDAYISYDRSFGVASQAILNETAIRESLDTLRLDVDGNPICGLERTSIGFGFLTPRDCVVVDFFSPTLFTTAGGTKDFATQAETDFIAGDSINTTEIETIVVNGIVTGDAFDLPGGTVGVVIGGEFREERINTVNDFVRVNGLGASEIPDTEGNTIGNNSIWGIYGEIELPIVDQLTLNLSGRYSDDELAGDNFSYSVKGAFQPVDWLTLRASYGTTFRAPDLRALFLAGSVGTIAGGQDPCLVPNVANDGGVFNPAADDRPQVVIDNCIAQGADPTALGLQATTGITTTTGGNVNLEPETSDSLTAGFSVSQPFTDAFDLDFSLTYFNIDVEDQILASSAAGILGGCFNDEPNLGSPLCEFITRNQGDPTTATIANIDVPFLNVGTNTSEGIDFNVRFRTDLDRFLKGATFTYNIAATHYIEQLFQLSDDDPSDDNVGEFGNPAWSGIGTAALNYGNWTALWRTRYIDSVQQDDSDAFVEPADQSVTASACGILGANVACRDVDFADSEIYNDVSVTYDRDSWTLTFGIRNVFDNEPPLVDQGEAPSRLNIAVQSGYDLIGRSAFVSARKRF